MTKTLFYIFSVVLISLSFNTYQLVSISPNTTTNYSQKPNITTDSLIPWSSNRMLVWSDFKANPDLNNKYSAMTFSGISLNTKVYEDSIVLNIANNFEVYQSWVKMKNSITELLLEHEQGHFDITEIGARKMRKIISNSTFKDRKSTLKFVNDTYQNQWEVSVKLDAAYESETNHSINKEKQKEWTLKIAKMLKELDAYSSTDLVLKQK